MSIKSGGHKWHALWISHVEKKEEKKEEDSDEDEDCCCEIESYTVVHQVAFHALQKPEVGVLSFFLKTLHGTYDALRITQAMWT